MTGLIEAGGRVTGVQGRDARRSARGQSRSRRRLRRAPFDRARPRRLRGRGHRRADRRACGCAISRQPGEPGTGGRLDMGSFFVMLDRGDYWQLAYVIPKGGAEKLKAEGMPAFRQLIAKAAPFLAPRVGEIKSWDDVKLLDRRASTGCAPGTSRGCCASAMPRTPCRPSAASASTSPSRTPSPTANLLWKPLKEGRVTVEDLARVQKRREFPMKVTQRLQVLVQNNVIQKVLQSSKPLSPPWFVARRRPLPLAAAVSGPARRRGRQARARAHPRRRLSGPPLYPHRIRQGAEPARSLEGCASRSGGSSRPSEPLPPAGSMTLGALGRIASRVPLFPGRR